MLGTGDAGRSGAVEHNAHLANVLAHNFQRIQQRRARDDRGSVLVVVEDGDLHGLAQRLFDLEAVGGLDVFEVDAAERGLEQLAELDNLFGIVAVNFDVEDIDIGKALEEYGFALHDRLSREGADVAQAEHCGAVAQNGDQIAAAGVFEGVLRILLNFETWLGYTRGVGQAKIALRAAGLGGSNFNLSRAGPMMIIEHLLLADEHKFPPRRPLGQTTAIGDKPTLFGICPGLGSGL